MNLRGPADPDARIAIVYGTRPEAVKLQPIIDLLGPRARVIHSGQHYDAALAAEFDARLGLAAPDLRLSIGGLSRGGQIGAATAALDAEFRAVPVSAVVVQGDTNTALAGALAANAADVPLVHIEAGLRSHDRRMPEEHNRVVIDHLADLACAPTSGNRSNLLSEGITDDRIEVTGNPVVEAVIRSRPAAAIRAQLLDRFGLRASEFVFATFHRPENVDDPAALDAILHALGSLPLPVLFPVHPRTAARARDAHLAAALEQVTGCAPLAYGECLGLMESAAILVTDSGGIQEEASVLKRPTIVMRRSTERPEVLGTFATLVDSPDALRRAVAPILADVAGAHARLAPLPCPFGDGFASQRCVAAITTLVA